MKNMKNYRLITLSCLMACYAASAFAQTPLSASALWPEVTQTAKPASRWWWLGSAVDKENLDWNIREYARTGLGELEITPIYGVQGNDANDIPFLSPEWMEMFRYCTQVGDEVGIKIDMSTGTGWPFGGPSVGTDEAATRATFSRNADGTIRYEVGKTRQQVKRAAPGGEGNVVDHYNKTAVKHYLDWIAKAFKETGTAVPNNFFNDSYEVYGADWTPDFLAQFAKRRGYRLEDHFDAFVVDEKNGETRTDEQRRVVSDYRETLSELLIENFSTQWTAWAHKLGTVTRGQAHGSPSNLIDTYAAYDIPECEGFGLSPVGIQGLRVDSIRKKNDADFTVLKYASSAAHISGKPLVSSETFTWLTEHFRTSLSQCKPDMDLMFVTGVNHMFFHGTCYSPKDDVWPGWKFYASMDMSPTNPQWRDAPDFFRYIARCQSFLQMGLPDNDFLVYLPIYDIWHEQPGRYLMFDIHKMRSKAPHFIEAVNAICDAGYDVDYISDAFLQQTKVRDGQLVTPGKAAYKAVIVPDAHLMPAETLAQLERFARQGAKVVFMGGLPDDVPGLGHYDKRHKAFMKTLAQLQSCGDPSVKRVVDGLGAVSDSEGSAVSIPYGKGTLVLGGDYDKALNKCGAHSESMRRQGLRAIRRVNDKGHHYFISNLQDHDEEIVVTLGVDCADALFFDPMTERVGRPMRSGSKVFLQLKSGESIILQTFDEPLTADVPDWEYLDPTAVSLSIERGWTLTFPESVPAVRGYRPDADHPQGTFRIGTLGSWTELPEAGTRNPELTTNMGVGSYSNTFQLPAMDCDEWLLDLGDVRESARVYLNDKYVGTAWCVPFQLRVGEYLHPGENTLRVEVVNLPANRIAQMDRAGIVWRKFKDINVADLQYKNTRYDWWTPVPSGLCSDVKLIPCKTMTATKMQKETAGTEPLRLR